MRRVSDVKFVRKIIFALALLLPLSLDLSLNAVQGYLPGAALRLPLGFHHPIHNPIHDRFQQQQQNNYQAKHARLLTRSRLKATEEAKQEGAKQYKPIDLEQLKNELPISTVIKHYIPSATMTPGTSSGTALCPFHPDTTPSLHFTDSKRMYKCFACGHGGDVFKFVQSWHTEVEKADTYTFGDALRTISDTFGSSSGLSPSLLSPSR
eukprot:CAMPEP_0182470424 /NCGR_PEP_ID=MMETSP1319-20130603/18687_1 /TAXON_ID=172717 /ORGANISM="Bolidomonas pacifica, Strain RCC208" /LENGTH=207 /DNA_ID=CAMNT_0024670865 /DNA_START=215 /DNA_END=834 /DNA_ORIENTATION=-